MLNVYRDARPTVPLPELAVPAASLDEGLDVRAAIEGLRPVFREPLLLAVYDQLSYEEIAAVLDCPIGTVRSRIARAKRDLAVTLAPDAKTGTRGGGARS